VLLAARMPLVGPVVRSVGDSLAADGRAVRLRLVRTRAQKVETSPSGRCAGGCTARGRG
jgi:hypothetical protein